MEESPVEESPMEESPMEESPIEESPVEEPSDYAIVSGVEKGSSIFWTVSSKLLGISKEAFGVIDGHRTHLQGASGLLDDWKDPIDRSGEN